MRQSRQTKQTWQTKQTKQTKQTMTRAVAIARSLCLAWVVVGGFLTLMAGIAGFATLVRCAESAGSAKRVTGWSLYRGDLQNTGSTSAELKPPLSLTWKFRAAPARGENRCTLLSDGASLYFASGTRIYCLETATGNEVWEYKAPHVIVTTPALAEGILYVGTSQGHLVALDTNEGTPQWTFRADGGIVAPVAVFAGKVYFSAGRNFYVFDTKTRSILSQLPLDSPIASAPAFYEDNICLTTNAQRLTLIPDPSLAPPANPYSAMLGMGGVPTDPIVEGQRAYVGVGKSLIWFDLKAGLARFRLSVEGNITGSPCLYDKTLYFGTDKGFFYAVDSQKREIKWRKELKEHRMTTPCVASAGVIWQITDDGLLLALDASSGNLIWRYRLGDDDPSNYLNRTKPRVVSCSAPPTVTSNGLYVFSSDGKVYAFQPNFIDVTPPQIEEVRLLIKGVRGGTFAYRLRGSHPDEEEEEEELTCIPGNPPVWLTAVLVDDGSGVDESSIKVECTGKEDVKTTFQPQLARLIAHIHPLKEKAEGAERAKRTGKVRAGAPLVDGQYVVTISMQDYRGNSTKRAYKFEVDNSLPLPKPAERERELRPGGPGGAGWMGTPERF